MDKKTVLTVIQNADRFLLVKSSLNFGQFTNHWYPPGGNVEIDNIKLNLRNKVKIEIGLDIMPIKKLTENINDMGQKCEWWISELVDKDQKIQLNTDIYGVGWFTLEEMKSIMVWPATKALFNEFFDADLT